MYSRLPYTHTHTHPRRSSQWYTVTWLHSHCLWREVLMPRELLPQALIAKVYMEVGGGSPGTPTHNQTWARLGWGKNPFKEK